jgi:hypothetical protein
VARSVSRQAVATQTRCGGLQRCRVWDAGYAALVKLAQGEPDVTAVAAPLTSGTPGAIFSLARRVTVKPLK